MIVDEFMLVIKNVKNIKGEIVTRRIESKEDKTIDATGLTILPALIDPHVHFRVPGQEHKENWESGARAAIAGGVTTVLDMPNNSPSIVTKELILKKRELIEKQLGNVNIPLRYGLYLGADKNYLAEIGETKSDIVAIKVFLGSSTGNLLIDDYGIFEKICKQAKQNDVLVAVHAEDENLLSKNAKKYQNINEPSIHSKIRFRQAAIRSLEKSLEIAKKIGNRLYVLHASTKEEVKLVKQAKKDGIKVSLETTPHHLFLTEEDYKRLGTKAQVNPPLRTKEDQEALWQGIADGTIDTIGTDHAPHTEDEKNQPYRKAPSGIPGIETCLPLLLDAFNNGKITLQKIVAITRTNVKKIFKLTSNDDIILVDLNKKKEVRNVDLKTKCGWSPFAGHTLQGWPVYTVLRGRVYKV